MKIKLVFSYDGSKFNGFQRLNNKRTVQKELESALSKIYNQEIQVKGAGRTDAGVHANGQVVHFEIDREIYTLKSDLNKLLMPDIIIKSVSVVNDDFHARHSAKKKEYIYKINLGEFKTSYSNYYYQPNFNVDVNLMKKACKYMIGTHDFNNFVSGKRDNYISTIYSITFKKTFGKLEIHFVGIGFYRYMVRNLVGALLEVAKCKENYMIIDDMLNKPNFEKKLPTAPANGLYLNKIWY